MDFPQYAANEVDAEFYDATALTSNPAFWAYHLCGLVSESPGWFGVPEAEFRRLRDEQLFNPLRWPVLRIPLAGGHEIVIVYETYELIPAEEYEYAVQYWLRIAGQEPPHILGAAEMEGAYGGIRWPELVKAAAPAGTGGIQQPSARLLALLPILTDADIPQSEFLPMVSAALREQGATAPEAQTQALLTDRQYGEDATWSVDAEGIWTCDTWPNSRLRTHSHNPRPAAVSRALAP
ncbi:hypothetical protein GFY24_18130 [Nocardia sp. SYP-A9097]|uniref:hypothetical protein n=1 Tax=Nocardia sp. SYP-A9097 TaxID=2663237 RepID=UPI00129A2F42|nr:hypothetical protein [Nocardia sp. SYP-A9097]MRH89342.1 hypothetical protein [Nocardia sp. SYP-A9097]